MLTLLGYGALAVLVAVGLFFLASYLLPAGEQIAPPVRDEPLWDLPAGRPLGYEDVATVRLPVALRGYRFAETDSLIDRLADELRARDDEIARLRRHLPDHPSEQEERWQPRETPEPTDPRGADDASGADDTSGADDVEGADEPIDMPDRPREP